VARPDCSAVIQTNFAAVHIRTRPSQCEVCGGHSGTGTGLPRSAFGFPLSVSFHHWPIVVFVVPEGRLSEDLETSIRKPLRDPGF